MKMTITRRTFIAFIFSVALHTTAAQEMASGIDTTTTTTAITSLPVWSTILFNGPILNVDAYGGKVFAKSDVGLLELVDGRLVVDEFLGRLPIGRIWIQPPSRAAKTDKAYPALYVVTSTGKLYQKLLTDTGKQDWVDCLEGTELEGRKVLDIHGKAEFIVFIVENVENKSKTVRGDIYISYHTSTDTSFNTGTRIGSFPATFVTVSPKGGTIATYGDFHGQYGAGVAVSSDFGKIWRHSTPQAAGKEGKVYVDEDRVVVTSTIGNVMVSFDKGRSFKALTPMRSKLPLDHYTDVAAMDNMIFLATKNSGMFVSLNDGESFEKRSTFGYNNFPVNTLNAVAVDILDRKVYVAYQNGMSVRDIANKGASEPVMFEHLSLWKRLSHEAKAIF